MKSNKVITFSHRTRILYVLLTSFLMTFQASATVESTVYDLLKNAEETDVSPTVRVNIDGIYYFTSESSGEPAALWQYNPQTGEQKRISFENPLDDSFSVSELESVGGQLLLYEHYSLSSSRMWSYTPGDELARLVNLHGLESYEVINPPRVIDDTFMFVASRESGNDAIWKYDVSCNCVTELTTDFSSILAFRQYQDTALLFGRRDIPGHENVTELWQLEVSTGQVKQLTDFTSSASGEASLDLATVNLLGDKLFLKSWSGGGEQEFWYYDFTQESLHDLSGIGHLRIQDDQYYYLHIQRAHGQWLAVYLSPVNNSINSQLWLYQLDTRELKKVADLKEHTGCTDGESYFEGAATPHEFHNGALYYRSNESGTNQGIWRYDLTSGEKTELTPAALSNVKPANYCWVSHFVSNGFMFSGQHMYFSSSVAYDPIPENSIDATRSGLWHIDTITNEATMLLSGNIETIAMGEQFLVFNRPFPGEFPESGFWKLHASSAQLSEITEIKIENERYFSTQFLGTDLVITNNRFGNDRRYWRVTEDLQISEIPKFTENNSSSFPKAGVVSSNKLYFLAKSSLSQRYLWQVGASGVPQLLPVNLGRSIDDVTIRMVTDKALIIRYRDENYRLTLVKINTVDNSVDELTALNEGDPDQFVAIGDKIVALESNGLNSPSKVYVYDVNTKQTQTVLHDTISGIGHVNLDSIYLKRYINGQSLLWRWDIAEQKYYSLQEQEPTVCRNNIPSNYFTYRDYFTNERNTVGKLVYLKNGELIRHDPETDEIVNFGCAGRIHGVSQNLLVFDHPEDGNAALYRIDGESLEKQWLADFDRIGKFYQLENNTLFFSAVTEEHSEAIFRYNEQMDAPQMVMQIQGELLRLQIIDGEVFVITHSVPVGSSIPSAKLWRSSVSTPLFDFSELNHDVFRGDWFSFAGDIWLDAYIIQNDTPLGMELVRLHLNSEPVGRKNRLDFDGDGKADIGFREKRERNWNILLSKTGEQMHQVFGMRATDIPVPADYDGDGITDIAFRRSETRYWYVLNSSGSNYNSDRGDGIQRVRLGLAEEDIPVPADYDGDGITDMAVRRPSKSLWIIRLSSTQQIIQRKFGLQVGDIPVTGDFDGDGKADLAFRRPGTATWYIKNSSGSNYNSERGDGIQRLVLGLSAEDVPVTADYDGDGITDIAVWRASRSLFIIRHSVTKEAEIVRFNSAIDALPVVADYDGDGAADTALYFPDSGLYRIRTYALGKNDNQYLSPANDAFPLALPLLVMGSHL